jgi:hypothetical protein
MSLRANYIGGPVSNGAQLIGAFAMYWRIG